MAPPAVIQVCSRCDAPVSTDDLATGLAIHLDGDPICPMCIELLPVETRVQINQARVRKGLAVTAYRMPHPKHPKFTLYTFSSAAMLTIHRRALRTSGRYDVRPLSHKSLMTSVDRLLMGRSRHLFAGGVVLAVLVLAVLAWSVVAPTRRSATPPPEQPSEAPVAVPAPPAPASPAPPVQSAPAVVQRGDLPADPYAAWTQLAAMADPPAALVDRLAGELAMRRQSDLAAIRQVLIQSGLDAGLRRLEQQPPLPHHPALAEAEAEERRLRALIRESQAATVPAPAAPAAPATRPADPFATPAAIPVPAPAPTQVAVPAPSPAPASAPAAPVPVEPLPSPVAKPVPAPAPAASAITFLDWANSTAGPALRTSSLSEPENPPIPSPWPLVLGWDTPLPFVRSEVEPAGGAMPGWKGRHALHLPLPAAQVAGGGVILTLHRGPKANRRDLSVVLDPGGRELTPIPLKGDWSETVILLPSGEPGPFTLHLGDHNPANSQTQGPFWCGPAVAVARRIPTQIDLGLAPSPLPWDLVNGDTHVSNALVKNIAAACAARGVSSWQSPGAFDPWAIKVLCGKLSDDWAPLMRKELPGHGDPARAQNLTVVEYEATPTWWTEHQLAQGSGIVNPKNFQVVVFIPNGLEAGRSAEAWAGEVKDLMQQVLGTGTKNGHRAGFLPVLVLGGVDDPSFDAGNWGEVRKAKFLQGLPLIDLSVLPRSGLTKRAWRAESAQAIGHALANLAYQLRWRQGKK